MGTPFASLLLFFHFLSAVSSLERRSIRPVIEISNGEIGLPPMTSGYQSACSTITTTIGTRVDTIPVPCYDAKSTPTLEEEVIIGTTTDVLIIGPSGDVSIESKPWLLHPTEHHAGNSASTNVGASGSSNPTNGGTTRPDDEHTGHPTNTRTGSNGAPDPGQTSNPSNEHTGTGTKAPSHTDGTDPSSQPGDATGSERSGGPDVTHPPGTGITSLSDNLS
ncbi:MAG: hypothetical protein Q9222_007685 [Ikaeria aurantiellina]